MLVSAPGKIVLGGEYAVLEGYSAVAAAVNRRVYVTATRQDHNQFVAQSSSLIQRVYAQCGPCPNAKIEINSDELYIEQNAKQQKLGLGSSAAVAVALTATLKKLQGHDIDKQDIFEAALAAHRAHAGGKGSGIDVAASCYGGFICYPNIQPLDVKLDLQSILLVYTKQSANTRHFLDATLSLKRDCPLQYNQLMKQLGEASIQIEHTLCHEFEWCMLQEIMDFNVATLEDLGKQAGIEIVTGIHRTINRIAHQVGGAAKPSGAGGGDVSICFVPPESRELMIQKLIEQKLTPLPVSLGTEGVQ